MAGGETQKRLTPLASNYSFTIVPDWVYQCLNLSGNDAIIFSLILSYQQKDGYYGGSFKYIEKRYGIDLTTAKRILTRLENKQYLIKQKGDSKTRNKYTINFNVVNELIKKQQGQNATSGKNTLVAKCHYPSSNLPSDLVAKCTPSNKYSNKYSNKDIYTDANASVGLEKKEDDKKKKKKEADTKVSTSEKDNTPSKKEQEEKYLQMFDEFWKLYPKKKDKANTRKKWLKLKPDDELFETIISALKKQMQSEQWQKNNGQYIPYPTTWINGRRWEDEIKEAAGSSQPQEDAPCKKPYYQEPIATF